MNVKTSLKNKSYKGIKLPWVLLHLGLSGLYFNELYHIRALGTPVLKLVQFSHFQVVLDFCIIAIALTIIHSILVVITTKVTLTENTIIVKNYMKSETIHLSQVSDLDKSFHWFFFLMSWNPIFSYRVHLKKIKKDKWYHQSYWSYFAFMKNSEEFCKQTKKAIMAHNKDDRYKLNI